MCSEVQWNEVMWSKEKWNEVIVNGEMCVLSLIDSYVAVTMFCAVRCVIIIWLSLLFLHHPTSVF